MCQLNIPKTWNENVLKALSAWNGVNFVKCMNTDLIKDVFSLHIKDIVVHNVENLYYEDYSSKKLE